MPKVLGKLQVLLRRPCCLHALQHFSPEQWPNILPILIHGDKGRTYSKASIFNFSWESAIGLLDDFLKRFSSTERTRANLQNQQEGGKLSSTCGKRAQEQMVREDLDDSLCPKRGRLNQEGLYRIPHNGKGHTLVTRFLVTAVPSKVFKGDPLSSRPSLNTSRRT